MAIINRAPDSFFDKGATYGFDAAVAAIVRGARRRHPQVALSVDTWRAEGAEVVVAAGADLLNDAWGGHDPRLAEVAAATGAGLVCTHTGGAVPRTRPHRVGYADVAADVVSWCRAEAKRALGLGVRPDGIVIDPGHDFGKNSWHSLAVTRRLDELVALGWPVLVSLSNKDFVGETLRGLPPGERLEGTLATTAVSAGLGARGFPVDQGARTRP